MLKLFSDIKKSFTEDNLTKLFIIITIIAVIYSMNKNSQREFFQNTNSSSYSSSNDDNIFYTEYIKLYDNVIMDTEKDSKSIDYIMQKTNISDQGMVVNIGCKTGWINNYLKQNFGVNSIGLDRSSYMIDTCRTKHSNIDFNIFNIDTLDTININHNQPITHIICLNMEIYHIDNIEYFFTQCYKLLERNGYLILNLVDHKKYNNTSVYSRINHFNPNDLSIKKVNDSVIKFNDIVYHTRYRVFPNDFGNDTVWFTETIENINDNSVHENIHNFNAISNKEIENIAYRNNFKLVNIIDVQFDLGLSHYNNEYLYIFKK